MGNGDKSDSNQINNIDDWKKPGFHRPLAGILYNIIYILIAAGFGVMISIWLMPNVIYPFPEGMGFENLTMQIFVVYFSILDLGIGASIQRFVAEENVTNPKRAVQYVQFFIWYQMFSGLAQVSAIALWVIFVLPGNQLAYASWFFLLYSTIQYPGMLGVFRGTLEAYQRFDKANIITFLQYQIFENIFRIICILIGRKIGIANPAIGELMGATMGSIIGKYLKDFVTAWLAAHWLSPILREVDPSFSTLTLFRVDFDREIVKKSLMFGLKVLAPGLISPLANTLAVNMMVAWLPNYSTIIGLYSLGEMLATMVSTLGFTGVSSTIAESYLNDKKKLTLNYFQQYYHWSAVISCFMIGLLFAGSYLIGIIAGDTFTLVTPIIQHFMIWKFMSLFAALIDQMFTGCGKPQYNIILIGAEQVTRLFLLWLLLVPIPSSWVALVYSQGIGWAIKWVVGVLLFHKQVMPIKIGWWQTFIAPFLAAMVEGLYVWIGMQLLFDPLMGMIGKVPAAILLIVIGVLTGPFLIYFPALGLFGGFDEDSLKTLEKATELSGPSKRIILIIKNGTFRMARKSPLHNRFPIDETGVREEIEALLITRQQNLG